jgi:hypothetical protein
LRFRKIFAKQFRGSKAFGRKQPSQPPRGYTGNPPRNTVALLELLLFFSKERDEGLADVAKSDDAEIVGADAGLPKVKWLYLVL